MGKIFIGIDQSITETAITIMTSPSEYNTYVFRGKGDTTLDKIKSLHREIGEFFVSKFTRENWSKCLCFIEGGSFNSGGRLFTLGQLSGALLSSIFIMGIPYKEIPPSSVKKFISGKGHASKNAVMLSILRKYGIKFTNDNKADSYVLALMAFSYANKMAEDFFFREELEWVSAEKKKEGTTKEEVKKSKPRYRRKKGEF